MAVAGILLRTVRLEGENVEHLVHFEVAVVMFELLLGGFKLVAGL